MHGGYGRAITGRIRPEYAPKACKNQGSCNINQIKTFRSYRSFEVVKKRWIVERTIAWLNRCRRLAKDWERLNRTGVAFLQWASIRIMVRKLCQATT